MNNINKIKKMVLIGTFVLFVSLPSGIVSADDDNDKGKNRNDDYKKEESRENRKFTKIDSEFKIEKNGKSEIKGAVIQTVSSNNNFVVKIFGLMINVDGSQARIYSVGNASSTISQGSILETKGTFNSSSGILTANTIKILSGGISVPPIVDTTPPIISTITISNTSTTSTKINWLTNEISTGKVYYGTSTPLILASSTIAVDSASTTNHTVNLSGLMASTTYYIVIESTNAVNLTSTSSQISFTTGTSTNQIILTSKWRLNRLLSWNR